MIVKPTKKYVTEEKKVVPHELFLVNTPFVFKPGIYVYPPTVEDFLNRSKHPYFNIYIKMLTLSQEDIWDEINEKAGKDPTKTTIPEESITPFKYLLANCHKSQQYLEIAEKAFHCFTNNFVKIIPEEEVIIFTNNIDKVQTAEEISAKHMMREEEFLDFQNLVRMSIGEDTKEPPRTDIHPKVQFMLAKRRLRDRIKQKQGVKNGLDLSTMLCAIYCMGIGLTPLNIGKIPYASIRHLFKMSQGKDEYDKKAMYLAGGAKANKVKQKFWIQKLEN